MVEINNAYEIIRCYVDNYTYVFSEEKVIDDEPDELWKKQFGYGDLWWE